MAFTWVFCFSGIILISVDMLLSSMTLAVCKIDTFEAYLTKVLLRSFGASLLSFLLLTVPELRY